MPITSNDIVLLASQRPTDEDDGGGFMTGNSVQDSVENNLFPDISTLDRVFGRTQLRKAFAAILSDSTDTYLGAHLILDDAPDDPAVGSLIFAAGGQAGERAAAIAALAEGAAPKASATEKYFAKQKTHNPTFNYWSIQVPAGEQIIDVSGDVISDTRLPLLNNASFYYIQRTNPGSTPAAYANLGRFSNYNEFVVTHPPSQTYTEATDEDGSLIRTFYFNFSILDSDLPTSYSPQVDADAVIGSGDGDYIVADDAVSETPDDAPESALAYGVALTVGSTSADSVSLSIDRVSAKLVPWNEEGSYPSSLPAYCGIDPTDFQAGVGYVTTHRVGDAVVIHHTALTSPATAVNGGTVDCGRENLARVRVIGNNGTVITTGYTADLEAGTVTFSNVAGYSQPVRVEHRIEDMAAITNIVLGTPNVVTINRAVTHAFPSGSKVSSALIIGDMQALVGESFEQSTWTGVFSDDLIGSSPLANFNQAAYPITAKNIGAISERWVCIFTSSTNFRVVGEQVGEILTSNTSSPTAPLNPATLEPYFTIPAEGWGVGWAAGNVLRFNTRGANHEVWAARTTSPSDPNTGSDSLTIGIRGDVDA